jgi:hypothetical protein
MTKETTTDIQKALLKIKQQLLVTKGNLENLRKPEVFRSNKDVTESLLSQHDRVASRPLVRHYSTFKSQCGIREPSRATEIALIEINNHEPSPLYGFIYPEEMYL